MINKNEVKYIQSLYHKKNGEEEGLFIAEGPKLVGEILTSDFEIKNIFATAQWADSHKTVANCVEVSQQELEKISNLQTPNQVVALVQQKKPDREPVLENMLTLMLDGLQDPGNMGTILRIADWFGITQIIASGDTVNMYNPKVIQASMGSFLRVSVYYTRLKEILKRSFVPVYGALLNGKSIYDMDKIQEGILVIGNESRGIRDNIMPFIFHPVTIPRRGKAESLNAAVATGIILSHIAP